MVSINTKDSRFSRLIANDLRIDDIKSIWDPLDGHDNFLPIDDALKKIGAVETISKYVAVRCSKKTWNVPQRTKFGTLQYIAVKRLEKVHVLVSLG